MIDYQYRIFLLVSGDELQSLVHDDILLKSMGKHGDVLDDLVLVGRFKPLQEGVDWE